MKIHKKTMFRWLNDFIDIVCQLNDVDFRLSIESGNGVLFAPVDIFNTLKRRFAIEYNANHDFHFIVHLCDMGSTIVKVQPLESLHNGLILKTANE